MSPSAQPLRPKITAITLHLQMPDGSTQVHTIDPTQCHAMAWSDEAVKVLGKFYDKGGPAEGKRMSRMDFLKAFPHAGSLIGDHPDLQMTPATIDQLWSLPQADGTGLSFLAKTTYNSTNGK